MTNCHKNITSPCCTEVYTLARATRVVTLPCRHPGLRAIHNQMLPSLLQDRRALTVAPRAFNDNSLPVTKICIRFMKSTWPWPWSTHHRAYTAHNRLFVPSNSTAQRYRDCEIHPSTLRIHFPYLHHAYKLLMQEKCYASPCTHKHYRQCLL